MIFYRVDIKNQTLEIDLNLPSFRIDSRYNINGTILVVPISGNGKFVGNFSKSTTNKVNYRTGYTKSKRYK